ncbi:dihydrodipicolinate reductase [Rhodophyticola porphyridii]|uniref:dihydrodipicolinate reductase n=2 Tax=Alphaproteobacteria TaxID=28211 RepID=UPI0035D02CA4
MADEFSIVDTRESFVSLVEGRELTRFGIRLNVTPSGEIVGRAFGSAVTGQWDWDGRYFCRDLFYGDEDLGPNCQLVQVNGNTLRFTSDRGAGIYADLRLR